MNAADRYLRRYKKKDGDDDSRFEREADGRVAECPCGTRERVEGESVSEMKDERDRAVELVYYDCPVFSASVTRPENGPNDR